MAEIQRYVLVGLDDVEGDEEYATLHDAIAHARVRTSTAVISRTYEYTDSELVWTPDDSDIWPPTNGEEK
jgi:hypothetical protein